MFANHYALRCALLLCLAIPGITTADSLTATPPSGYSIRSLEIGVPYAGAIAIDQANLNRVYVSVAKETYGSQYVVAMNVETGTTTTVTPEFGTIGGMAVLANGDLTIVENRTSDTIFRAHDLNADGDFLDGGELTELIQPILGDGNFTGAQASVAPSGNASAIPAGALLVQTADDATSSELLVIENPTSTPTFRPADAGYFSGYQFNGGFDFDATGNLIFGISQYNFSTWTSSGKLLALVNSNGNATIETGESQVLAAEPSFPNGLTDLAVTRENLAIIADFSGVIRAASLPADLLSGTVSPSPWLATNAIYISSIEFDTHANTFAPGAAGGARLYIGGFASFPDGATNLLVVEPQLLSSVESWSLYN